MSNYPYKELDPAKNEIRILRFVDSASTTSPDLVHCTLHHVSLDDLLPAFRDFLSEMRLKVTPDATQRWLEADRQGWPMPDSSRPLIAYWRYNLASQPFVTKLVDTMGLGLTSMFHMPAPRSIIRTVDEDESLVVANELESLTPATASVAPRFRWGDFEALSYCWESDVRERDIYVNDIIVQIPKNLEALLQRLQKLPEAQSGMGFWIDGLCINQLNVLEKNHQVQLMKRIYTQALGVIVWLGEEVEGSNQAVDFSTQLADVEVDLHTQVLDKSDVLSWYRTNGQLDAPWTSVMAMWSRSYFGRMWIIQELAMNTHMSMFMCGDRQFPREAIHRASQFCMEYAKSIDQVLVQSNSKVSNSVRSSPHSVWQTAYNTKMLVGLGTFTGSTPIEAILDLARKSKVKYPVDKIFGLLGMLPEAIAASIVPDYSKSHERVYTEFAQVMLQHCTHLDEVLSWCTYNEQSALASWVPDWASPFNRYHIRWFRESNASGGIAPIFSLPKDGSKLCTKGLLIDEVASMSSISSQDLPYGTVAQESVNASNQALTFGRYHDKPRLAETLSRTLHHAHPMEASHGELTDIYWVDWDRIDDICDQEMEEFWTYGMPNITGGYRDAASDSWKLFDRFRQTNAYFSIFGFNLRQFFPNMREYHHISHVTDNHYEFGSLSGSIHRPYELTASHRQNIQLATVALNGRKLITAKTGYLGLAPDETRIGDTIAVLYGCNYPVVLRSHNDGFNYVGECYIDGLMNEEAIKARDHGEYREEEIVIL